MLPTGCGRQKDTPAAISSSHPFAKVDGLPENLSYNRGRNAGFAVA
jgi:hypothetical protein